MERYFPDIYNCAQDNAIGAAVLARVFAEADAQALPIRVGALRESASNRFYVRHGFQLIERGEFDNYYIRQSQNTLAPTAQLFLDTLENS